MAEPRPADPPPVWVWLPLAGMLLTLPVSWPAWRAPAGCGERRRVQDGTDSQGEGLRALADAGVRVAWREAHVSGIGVGIGWLAWFVATAVLGLGIAVA